MGKITFIELLKKNTHIIIPTIQRDYAQGRNEGSDKDLCEEVRSDIINNFYKTLTSASSTEMILDYVYGSDENSVFYPIDGQQRLTTLFLLHWYIGKKEKMDNNSTEFELLKRFTYEIRDTSKEFCQSLININIDFSLKDEISKQIKNSPKYHRSFDLDPTVSAMLVMLDKIDDTFRNTNDKLWGNLNRIKFWVLSLQQFGLTDDLFVKMNARGKRLSKFDVFKSDLESALSKIGNSNTYVIDLWKREIDNEFLDKYWAAFGVDYAEKNLFRTIVFFLKNSIVGETDTIDDEWELNVFKVKYNDLIKAIKCDMNLLNSLCILLSKFDVWKDLVIDSDLFVKTGADEKKILYYKKAEIFAILYWFSKDGHKNNDYTFKCYNRIIKNYIYSLRQPDYKPVRRFSSSIDNRSVAKTYANIKKIVDNYDDSCDFYEYIKQSNYQELEFEIEKLKAMQSGIALNEIEDLENLACLGRNIHNFFSNDSLLLEASTIEQITTNNDLINKTLRIIFSYADDRYGNFKELLFDPIGMQSGKKQLYYENEDDQATSYFHMYSFRTGELFGDRVLTASGKDQYKEMSDCVKKYASSIRNKLNMGIDLQVAIDELLCERLYEENYDDNKNIKWYIVKYKEFFTADSSTVISTLRRKNYGSIDIDNIYDIQCLKDGDKDFSKEHYHPFYLALCHLLKNNVTIVESSLKYIGVEIEFKHPCILSNGWKIRIDENGNWKLDFGKNCPTLSFNGLSIDASGLGHLDCTGEDSIQKMAEFLNAL